jgi:hypothetical protein
MITIDSKSPLPADVLLKAGTTMIDLNCTRAKFAQSAQFICDAIPDDAVCCHYFCTSCRKHHLRINLLQRYSENFVRKLGKKVERIVAN